MEPVFGKFYKYRPIGKDGSNPRNRLRSLIVDRELYLAKPSSLNDPFDCRPNGINTDAKTHRKHLIRVIKEDFPAEYAELSEKQLSRRVSSIMARHAEDDEYANMLYRSFVGTTGIFSMSKTPLSSLQWAHYAQSHKGVALEFKVTDSEVTYAVPVNYTNDRLQIDATRVLFDSDYATEQAMLAVSRKSLEWEYEEEVRLIQEKSGPLKYKPELLTGVIFGARTPNDDRNYVLALLDEAGAKVSTKAIRLDTKHYGFHTVDL